jgi:Tol biopolymer transport system component
MGTVGYMSPEQVRGQTVDHRSDLFAFGAILYEMLSGQRAFRGDSPADTMSAILKEDPPDLSATNRNVSPALERLVDHCLEKNPEERFHSARDLAFALEALSASTASSTETIAIPAITPPRLGRRELISWSLAALFLIVAVVFAIMALRSTTSTKEEEVSRFYIYAPENTKFGGATDFISPDGRKLIFNVGANQKGQLWIRSIDSLTARPIPGTEDGGQAFWSPDSRFIAFFADGKLKKVDVSGGAVQTLTDADRGRGGTWNKDGVILFSPAVGGGLFRVSAAGGAASPVITVDSSHNQGSYFWPRFLPDGKHFLYLARSSSGENSSIYVGSLDSKESKLLVQSSAGAMYALPGYLLFLKAGALMAQPFDAEKLQLSGEPFQVVEEVGYNPLNGRAFFCVSNNGVLVYRSNILRNSQLTWFDRTGKQLGTVVTPGLMLTPSLSPDEKQVAILRATLTSASDIWLVDLSRQSSSRFTFDPAMDTNPVWSPDGSRIVFSSDRSGEFDLYWKPSNGAGNEELLLKSDNPKFVTDWSNDGRFILYQESAANRMADLWALPLFGDKKPFPIIQSNFRESQAKFSPDGRWIAYVSDESGSAQVYVQNFPTAGRKLMVSINGGFQPRWRRDGKELFYFGTDNKLMAVQVKTNGDDFEAGSPSSLFQASLIPPIPIGGSAAEVTHDGQRFLINVLVDESSSSPAIVVQNWTASLKR